MRERGVGVSHLLLYYRELEAATTLTSSQTESMETLNQQLRQKVSHAEILEQNLIFLMQRLVN